MTETDDITENSLPGNKFNKGYPATDDNEKDFNAIEDNGGDTDNLVPEVSLSMGCDKTNFHTPHGCDKCDDIVINSRRLEDHIKSVHVNKICSCHYRGIPPEKLSNIGEHIEIVHASSIHLHSDRWRCVSWGYPRGLLCIV